MKQLVAFTKKEFMEVWRTGKFLILIVVFALFGIMNPAIAKLTPWMLEQFSDSLEESGFVIMEMTVDALTSWAQFYKNIPMALIVFLLMFSGITANELQKGTLVNMITKGMSRKKVVIAKAVTIFVLWTWNYWMCFGITYVYNAYFWDNDIAEHIILAAFFVYMLGVWLISLMLLMSTIFRTASAVTVGTGGVFFVGYLLSVLPDIKRYLPIKLMDAGTLLSGVGKVEDYTLCFGITVLLCVIQIFIAVVVFDKKKL